MSLDDAIAIDYSADRTPTRYELIKDNFELRQEVAQLNQRLVQANTELGELRQKSDGGKTFDKVIKEREDAISRTLSVLELNRQLVAQLEGVRTELAATKRQLEAARAEPQVPPRPTRTQESPWDNAIPRALSPAAYARAVQAADYAENLIVEENYKGAQAWAAIAQAWVGVAGIPEKRES